MLQPRYNFAAVTVFKRIAVLGGSCPTIDLHDADAVLQYDPKVNTEVEKLAFEQPSWTNPCHQYPFLPLTYDLLQMDMWGYQSLSVVKAAVSGSKTPIRRASKMRRRASLGTAD
jgi:hypothetical protein